MQGLTLCPEQGLEHGQEPDFEKLSWTATAEQAMSRGTQIWKIRASTANTMVQVTRVQCSRRQAFKGQQIKLITIWIQVFLCCQRNFKTQMLKIIKKGEWGWGSVQLKYIQHPNILTYIVETLNSHCAGLLRTFLSARFLGKEGTVGRLNTTFRFVCISTAKTFKLMRFKGFISLLKQNLSLGQNWINFHKCVDSYKLVW